MAPGSQAEMRALLWTNPPPRDSSSASPRYPRPPWVRVKVCDAVSVLEDAPVVSPRTAEVTRRALRAAFLRSIGAHPDPQPAGSRAGVCSKPPLTLQLDRQRTGRCFSQ
jgi:hypothetical protein